MISLNHTYGIICWIGNQWNGYLIDVDLNFFFFIYSGRKFNFNWNECPLNGLMTEENLK